MKELEASIEARSPASAADRARLWAEAGLERYDSDPAAAEAIAALLESIEDERGLKIGRAWADVVRAWVAIGRGDERSGARSLRLAIGDFEAFGERRGAIRALNGLGNVYRMVGLKDRALDVLGRALSMAEALRWDEIACNINVNMGVVNLDLGNWAEAARRLESALACPYLAAVNRPIVLSNLALACVELGRKAEAEALALEAIEASRRDRLSVLEADAAGKYASMLERGGEIEASVASYREALGLASGLGHRRLSAEHGIALARTLSKTGKPGEARDALLDAAAIADADGMHVLAIRARSELAAAEAALGNWREAYESSREAARLERAMLEDNAEGQSDTFKAERESARLAARDEESGRLARLADTGVALSSAADPEAVGALLYERASALMPADVFGLALYDSGTGVLEFGYFMEDTLRVAPFSLPADADDSLAGRCVLAGETVTIADAERDLGRYVKRPRLAGKPTGDPIRSLLYEPVRCGGRILGALTVQSRKPDSYDSRHAAALGALAAYAGLALERQRLETEAKRAAGVDPLTGILDRERFLRLFALELQRMRRYGGTLGLVLFDLDRIKSINDRWGYRAGDLALAEAARRCSGAIRANDLAARFGSDGFALLLPGTGMAGALAAAERARDRFASRPLTLPSGEDIPFTASFGCASLCPSDDLDSLVARADLALCKAKEGGRDRVEAESLPSVPEGLRPAGRPAGIARETPPPADTPSKG